MTDRSQNPPALATLDVGSLEAAELRVVSVRGRESVSRGYRFTVACWARRPVDEGALLGARATLSLEVGGERRVIHGLVRRARRDATALERHEDREKLTLQIVPAFHVVGERVRSRIFQALDAPSIVARVLADHGIPRRSELQRKYAVRDVCVQYAETDRAFVERLLAEEGIFSFYDHDGGRERLVLADSSGALHLLPAPLPLRAEDGLARRASEVTRFERGLATKASRATLREFDFERPSHALEAISDADVSHPPIESYDHHGEHGGLDVRPEVAEVRLAQLRRKARTGDGASRALGLAAGAAFDLVGTPRGELDGRYTPLAVEHTLRVPELAPERAVLLADRAGEVVYENTFQCVPFEALPRPKPARKRPQESMLTAIVVGAPGQEIHTDRHGRVRVQFHWDREHQRDEQSSCWIRVSQTWAGTGWGAQFIPRVGMEVLVAFVGGDLDRPLVVGAVPNVEHPLPFLLPDQKTRSGIRTQTTRGGGGYNELSFEDLAGYESIRIRAERDLDEHVLQDHTEEVARDKVTRVGQSLTTHVASDRLDATVGDATRIVGGDHTESVAGAHRSTVDGASHLEVRGDRTDVVRGARDTHSHGRSRHRIEGGLDGDVGGHVRARVGEELAIRAEAGVQISSAGHLMMSTFQRASLTADQGVQIGTGDDEDYARVDLARKGVVAATSSRVIELAADEEIRLRVGKSVLRLLPDRIELETRTLSGSSERITFATDDASIAIERGVDLAGQTVRASSAAGGALSLGAVAALDGPRISLGGAQAADRVLREKRSLEEPTAPTSTVHLFDREGARLDRARYRIVMPGWSKTGETTSGAVTIPTFDDVDRCILEWGPPDAPKDDPYPFRSTIYLRSSHDPDEALRRKLHNLGHTGPTLASSLAHAAATLGDAALQARADEPHPDRDRVAEQVEAALAETRPLEKGARR